MMSMLDTDPTPHPLAARCAQLLQARHQTVAVCESSTGGLITAALVAVPGCSAFFVGGCVAYAPGAREYLLGMSPEALGDLRPCTEAYALLCARQLRARLGCDWALAETGATGPAPNPYGAPPGRACLAVVGPVERTLAIATGDDRRAANMAAFANAALGLFADVLSAAVS
jgi:PncC family amidohydrolase